MSYQTPQVQMPPLTKINKVLIIVTGALFLLNTILLKTTGLSLLGVFGLSSGKFLEGHIYQLVTYPLITNGLMSFLFDALLFWFLGSELESIWGPRRYISFLLTTVVGAGLIYIIINLLFLSNGLLSLYPFSGLAGTGAAMCVSYAILFPERTFSFMMVFPIKAKYFCLILIGMSLYSGFFSPAAAGAWGQLGAMVMAVLWMYFVTKGVKIPNLGDSKAVKSRNKNHLKIVKNDDEKPPRFWQ